MISFRFHQRDGAASIATRALGAAGILLVALLTYLTVDSEAHERLHHDAGGPDHHCVVTAYAAGEVLLLASILTVRPAETNYPRLHVAASESLRSAVDLGFAPICGPPASQFSV